MDLLNSIRLSSIDVEPVMSSCVLEELRILGKSNINARVALTAFKNIPLISGEGKGDNCILESCLKHHCALLTSDRELLDRARIKNVKALTVQDGRNIVWY